MEPSVQLRLNASVKSVVLELNLIRHELGVSSVNLVRILLLDLDNASCVQMERCLLLLEQRNAYHVHVVTVQRMTTLTVSSVMRASSPDQDPPVQGVLLELLVLLQDCANV